ncbi:hypothetical protein N9H59_03735 [Flavobacteriaceae bacterium]|jgi:hypothetical protein|nr:hypothetical protein [Flavobacteriaceae bacterium]|tara:strand:+ start:26 stop:727 length:702 start_codon:yes stop_codon:yes gene_type:complete
MGLSNNFFKLDIKTIIIVGLIIFLLLRGCGDTPQGTKEIVKVDGKKYELVDKTIDTVFVEKRVEVPTYVPKYVDRVVEKIVKIPTHVDSLQIIKDYYSKFVTKDTLRLTYEFAPEITIDSIGTKPNPTLGFGVITDTITQNKVLSRDVVWNFEVPTIYNTTIVKDLPKTQLYYGFNLGGNKQDIFSTASGGLILKTKSDKLYQLNLGVQTNGVDGVVPYIGGGIFWKINLNKK